MSRGISRMQPDRHEINHSADAVRSMKPGDEDVGVGPIVLFGFDTVGNGSDLEPAPLGIIQDRAEHTGRVEMGKAEPIDGSIHADQRGRLHVPDQSVVFDGLIRHVLLFGSRSLNIDRQSKGHNMLIEGKQPEAKGLRKRSYVI